MKMKKIESINIIILLSLVILVFIGIGSTHYILSKIPEKIVANMLAIEYDKVGGIENYVKITKITRQQTIAWLKQYESQNWQVQAPTTNNNINSIWNKISIEQAKKVTWENTYILWNPDAEISFVEYSDLECPFCKKLHDSKTIDKILEEYDWKVNFIFKQYPLVDIHPQAPMEAETALCVWDLAWWEKYYEFIEKTFKNSKANGRSYTKETMVELWSNIWVNKTKLLACINSGKNKALANSQLNEWKSFFWITWTPWNVFINNKTGKWNKLPWAYPFEYFKQKIDNLFY